MVDLLNFRDGENITETPVPVAEFLGASNATAVRIGPDEDVRALLPYLDRIALVEVAFPAFGDGRGYSSARILRESGYQGELRASGDVLVDQLFAMRRVGFDSFAPNKALDPAVVEASLSRYADVYQKTIDGRRPIWAKRHEVN
ncbi:MAG: oxidoreductase [Sphingobium sp. 32-64-5]|nr:MAG: oxidoreductase [Sphingobium sp. 32-64-5]